MTPINGHSLTPEPDRLPEPKSVIARQVWDAGFMDGDLTWDDLDDEQRGALENLASDYIACHMRFLSEHGFRLIPPNTVLRPKSDEEAAMMTEAVRLYRAAKTRKGGLVGSTAPKLIIPKGTH